MLSLLLHAPNLTEEVTFPATYENLQLALWKLGLVVHDPGMYTIGSLAAEICCHTEAAEKIADLIQDEDTLEFVAEVIKLKLFFDWGIQFEKPLEMPDRGNRPVYYAGKQDLERSILSQFPMIHMPIGVAVPPRVQTASKSMPTQININTEDE